MNQLIKISIGLILLIAFSNAQAVLVSRFTVEREAGLYNPDETLVGKFKFRDGLTAGQITEADIVSFKWLKGSLFGFEKDIWNYLFDLDLEAILMSDGSIVPSNYGLYIQAYPDVRISEDIFGVQTYVILDVEANPNNNNEEGHGWAYCHTSEDPVVDFEPPPVYPHCDGVFDEYITAITYSFSSVRKVPEPAFGIAIPLVLAGLFAFRKRSSYSNI